METTATSGPIYQQLADRLASMIGAKSLRVGDRMPSVREFSRQQRVSIPTAMHAYAALEARGDIEARPKSGFFVRSKYADGVREPQMVKTPARRTDGAGLDPLDSVLVDHLNPALVPLGAALAGPDLLPSAALQRAMNVIGRRTNTINSYDLPPGPLVLRQAIARRSLEWGGALSPDDVIITNGCTEAVALAVDAVAKPGDTVIVEAPTYYGVARMLRDMGMQVIQVPVDSATGVDVDAIARVLRRTRVAACVLTPNFQNPVGCLMPDEGKREVLRLLESHGVALIEDDIYGDLPHDGRRPRCIKADDAEGAVMLCGSFSKTLAPGLRVGYIVPGRWYQRVLALKRSRTLGGPGLPSLAVADFVRNGGYDRHLRSMRRALRERVQQMRAAVAEAFPEGTALSRPAGGFVLWCELPAGTDSLELFRRAKAAGISIAPGAMFGPGGGFDHYIRLNCGHAWSDRLDKAIRTVGKLARQK